MSPKMESPYYTVEVECAFCGEPAAFDVRYLGKFAGDWEEKHKALCKYCLSSLKSQENIKGTTKVENFEPLFNYKVYKR